MMIVPLQAVPSQTLSIALDNQNCQINVYQRLFGLFFDLYVDSVLVIGGVLCLNMTKLVRSLYLGFTGDFAFMDLQGSTDPVYSGLGARYQLLYLETTDLGGEG